MIEDLQRAWESRVRAALAWREGQSIAPVLEALALSVALEATGALATAPSALREQLRRLGQRALLHVGAEVQLASDEEDDEDAEEALRIAVALARDGLRALSGRPADPEPERAAPSPRDLARLLTGRIDPYEAATIARALRASSQGRAELRWALRALEAGPVNERAPVMLAAADGEEMRDPAHGRLVATVRGSATDRGGESALVEIYLFADARLAAYASSDVPLRVEGAGVVTDGVQAGYWSGHLEPVEGAPASGTTHELVVVWGEDRHAVRLDTR